VPALAHSTILIGQSRPTAVYRFSPLIPTRLYRGCILGIGRRVEDTIRSLVARGGPLGGLLTNAARNSLLDRNDRLPGLPFKRERIADLAFAVSSDDPSDVADQGHAINKHSVFFRRSGAPLPCSIARRTARLASVDQQLEGSSLRPG
jgi:hypothetical protein